MPNLIFPGWECYGHDITAWGDTAEEATENWIDAFQECYGFPFTGDVPVVKPTERTAITLDDKVDALRYAPETRIQRAKTDEPPKTWLGRLIAVLVGTVIGLGLLDWIGMDP